MAYLELAENNPYNYMSEYRLSQGGGVTTRELYEYYVPIEDTSTGSVQWIREDFFDDLPEMEYQKLMSESQNTLIKAAEFGLADPELLSSIFGIGKKAKERRRERRRQRRERRQQRKDMRMQRKEARTQRQISGDTGFNRLIGTVGDIFKKPEPMQIEPAERGTQALEFSYSDLPEGAEDVKQKKWYQNPVVIIGGVAIAGLTIFALTRNK